MTFVLAGSSFTATTLVAGMSPGKSVQLVSVRLFLNCTRYVRPVMAFQLSEIPLNETTGRLAFKSAAMTWKVCAVLRGGLPLSVTTTVMEFVTVPGGPLRHRFF